MDKEIHIGKMRLSDFNLLISTLNLFLIYRTSNLSESIDHIISVCSTQIFLVYEI